MSAQEVLEFDPAPVLEASPFRIFTRKEWSGLRNGVEIPLTDEDLARLSGLIERISRDEVTDIYLPVAKLVNYHVSAAQELHSETAKFFGKARREDAVHRGHRGQRRGGQEHLGARAARASGALAVASAGGSGADRRLPAAERRA